MRKYSFIFLLIPALAIYYFFNPEKIWLILNKNNAEAYAEELLRKSDVPKTPDSFVDYAVSAQGEHVLFTRHNDNAVIYGYFPHNGNIDFMNLDKRIQWKRIDEKWYAGKVVQ